MIKRSIFTIVLATAAMVVQAQEWFKTDSVTIQGRIEGYDAEQWLNVKATHRWRCSWLRPIYRRDLARDT